MWTICLEQQYHVGKLKYHVSIFTTCGWVLQPSWNCYLCLRVEHSRWCVYGRKVRAQNACYICMIFYFPAIWSSIFLLHETSDLFHDPWRGHACALPVDAATVTQGRCLSLSLLEHRRSPHTRWPALPSHKSTQSPYTHERVQCCDLCWVQ